MFFNTAGRQILMVAVLPLVAIGCSPQQQAATNLDSVPVQAEGPIAEAPPDYPVGTVFTGNTTINGETVRVSDTLVEKIERDGRILDMVEHSQPIRDPGSACDGETHALWDAKTSNWVGCLADGEMLAGNEPHAARYAWPLQVGNKWTWKPRWVDRVLHPEWSGSYWSEYEVLAYEEVTVPAGTFMAFRVATTRVQDDAWYETNWYAPEPAVNVKSVWGRTDKNGYGPMEGMWELISIEYP